MEVIEVSRQIMTFLDAFKGSRPVIHNNKVMLIRGKSASRIKPDNLEDKLTDLFNNLNIKKVESNSQKAKQLTEKLDEAIRNSANVEEEESFGLSGIENLKHSFEISGFAAEYMIGQLDNVAVYVVIWLDKSGFGPMFVETMVFEID